MFYNEIEPYAAAWMRNLMAAGHIAAGRVDERSIRDLQPTDVRDARQAHFFAGLGGWSYALRLAGWPDGAPVWTGSCPCQPWSVAGRRGGLADERHLWPEWFRLIRECQPPVIFGEQVASPDGLRWFDGVSADLEGAGYAVGAADLCAAGVGAPHIRQRLYFVAHTLGERRERREGPLHRCVGHGTDAGWEKSPNAAADYGKARAGVLADPDECSGRQGGAFPTGSNHRDGENEGAGLGSVCGSGLVGDTNGAGLEGRASEPGDDGAQRTSVERAGGFWDGADWLPCLDGRSRAVEPGTFPLADGVSARVGRLRAYGNAIVPQVAATFVKAYLSAQG